ncbi:MAG TPA: hypothetical protein VMU57_12595 [Edaphobacter sp.]|uniref:hypothetical protein n=1 Tax=Edaphobacter sp. TaxID=1934404 RepID=UPI002B5D0F27|nr:hypothetical protein [Edaphobacter sp.]HUZ95740.1 hypothetical protein [Edaphobacter sp.]
MSRHKIRPRTIVKMSSMGGNAILRSHAGRTIILCTSQSGRDVFLERCHAPNRIGIVGGVHWHPSHTLTTAMALAAVAFTMMYELVCCFVRCSVSAWQFGRRMGELKGGR